MILLLSDLHLPACPHPFREAFIAFCQGPARQATQVYLLGDIFEQWIGDESLSFYAAELAALQDVTRAGVLVFFQHGNRDFLVGKSFAQATGVRLLSDHHVLSVQGQNLLLTHGDLLCTQDVGYQRWRRFSRQRWLQWLYLRLPLERRLRIAGGLRQQKNNKAYAVLDATEDGVQAAFQRHPARVLIHGHTHRPATHFHAVNGRTCTRIVLADWREDRMEWLEILHPEPATWTRRRFS